MNDDKFYGLIAQAEDIQKQAVALQGTTRIAIDTLSVTFRETVRDEVRGILTTAAETASTGLLGASSEAKAAASSLRRTGLMQGVFLLAAGVVIVGALYVAGNMLFNSRVAELAEVKAQITQEQATLAELRGKTWGLELVKYEDGTRGIILPKGAKFDRSGAVQDGRIGIVIKP